MIPSTTEDQQQFTSSYKSSNLAKMIQLFIMQQAVNSENVSKMLTQDIQTQSESFHKILENLQT